MDRPLGGTPLTKIAPYKVFGRLHHQPIHVRRRQAYEKRQGTKSRGAGQLRRSRLYDGLIGTPTLMMIDGTSRQEVEGAFKRVMFDASPQSQHHQKGTPRSGLSR